jgi:hypothetical protein
MPIPLRWLAAVGASLFYGREALALAVRVERVQIQGRAIGLSDEQIDADIADAFERARNSLMSTEDALDRLVRRWLLDLGAPTARTGPR